MAYVTEGQAEARSGLVSRLQGWADPLFQKDKSIINPLADAIVIYASPLWCLLFFLAFSHSGLWYTLEVFNYEHGVLSFAAGALTASHLLAVVFRSHMNKQVFVQWPLRFTLVPVTLFIALSSSIWLLITVSVIAAFWDVYHAGMQNFGLSRIYDARMGNDAHKGRLLDSMMNQVLYAGPLAAGVTLAFQVSSFESFADLGVYALAGVPGQVSGHASLIRMIVIPASLIACAVYLLGYWRLAKQGYKVSPHKVILLVTTAITSIIAWGFNPFAIAFATMNLFHAVQYFGILYAREGKNLTGLFRLNSLPGPFQSLAIIAILMVPTLAFGVWAMLATPGWNTIFALILTVTLMHYWYDGFIWSVRKKEV